MGNGQSLFYPDNPKRRDRAQQLADDCNLMVDEYKSKHANLESQLGEYKAKLDKVLAAFGCQTVDDLDRVVQQNATGDALKDWNSVKGEYDRAQVVDQVIMGAMGVVAIAGFTISTIGALAGGFGFFAGLAVTGDILLVLGVIGAIFDAIEGAILRSKLRDAINRLFTDRVKCKRVLAHIDNLFIWLPSLKEIYQVYEDADYSPEEIIARLKKKGVMKPVQEDLKAETFYKAASDLNNMDSRRGSWTNEDPNWRSLASSLDALDTVSSVVGHIISFSYSADSANLPPPPPPYEQSLKISLTTESSAVSDVLQKPLHLTLPNFVDALSANVFIHTDNGHPLGFRDGMVAESLKDTIPWNLALLDERDAERFGPKANFAPSEVAVNVIISRDHLYVGPGGQLVRSKEEATIFTARYAEIA